VVLILVFIERSSKRIEFLEKFIPCIPKELVTSLLVFIDAIALLKIVLILTLSIIGEE
jgi:hypothetical protein